MGDTSRPALTSKYAKHLLAEDRVVQAVELYRKAEMRNAGRVLSMDEAALEWIERFAADFAQNFQVPLK